MCFIINIYRIVKNQNRLKKLASIVEIDRQISFYKSFKKKTHFIYLGYKNVKH